MNLRNRIENIYMSALANPNEEHECVSLQISKIR